jgi:mannan endo-1,4-beta-mannosidase
MGRRSGRRIQSHRSNEHTSHQRGWGYCNVDYFELRPYAPPALLPIATQLSDPQASRRAQMLMNYLVSQYGQKTLSGQQGDVGSNGSFPPADYLSKSGGIVPAIRGSDFIDYSPSRIAHGSNPNGETERMINWAKSTGGIPSMMWHWNAPTDLIDTPDHEWWRGFYTDATTFDVQAALASPGSPKYNLLISDIDAIAVQLKKFQDAGVPVIRSCRGRPARPTCPATTTTMVSSTPATTRCGATRWDSRSLMAMAPTVTATV